MHNGYAPCGIGILGDSVKGELILVINIENLGVIDDEKYIAVTEPGSLRQSLAGVVPRYSLGLLT